VEGILWVLRTTSLVTIRLMLKDLYDSEHREHAKVFEWRPKYISLEQALEAPNC